MRISDTEAKGQPARHAEAEQDPIRTVPDRKARQALLEATRRSGGLRATAGPIAARSQDFLYGEDGLPE
jgi:hypothetical protein